MNTVAERVRELEGHSTMGTLNYYDHWTKMLRFTDGVKGLADICNCYWLIDLIASHQKEIQKKAVGNYYQFWRLEKVGDTWRASAWKDVPHESKLLAFQNIEHSDFPEELLPYDHLWVEGGVLILKEEH